MQDEVLRLRYLEALGIPVWKLRTNALEQTLQESPVLTETIQRPQMTKDLVSFDWESLKTTVEACQLCGLCQTRNHTVFGAGNRLADWLFIGEAPGQQEDEQGLPFVGNAGQLLTEMIRAIGLEREAVFITNVVKCRPPANRDPRSDESGSCLPYLHQQITLIKPKIIIALGRIAAQNLLKTDVPLSQLRGKIHAFDNIPLVVIYHPAYLLRSLLEKRKAWHDLQFAVAYFKSLNL